MKVDSRQMLSVVVAATDGPQALGRLLQDLAGQQRSSECEVIVVDGTGQIGADALTSFPGSTRLLGETGADVTTLRAIGVRAAEGQVVAFTEDHCRLSASWCASILDAWQAGTLAFGGPIENGSFRAPMDWAAYLVEFSSFMPPCPTGPTGALPGMNAAYDREKLLSVMDGPLCEPLVHTALRERGVVIQFAEIPPVTFERHFRFGSFLGHCFSSGRTFADLRLGHVAPLRRATYALAAASVLPVIMSLRIGRTVFGKERRRLSFVLALPWIALYTSAWGIGEAAGALQFGTNRRPEMEAARE